MEYIYILRLEEDKYYVGITTNPNSRIKEHHSGKGAKWTKLYKPIEIIEITLSTHEWQEAYTTLVMMKKYGLANVRGGPWVSQNLTDFPNILIEDLTTIEETYCIYQNELFKRAKKREITKPIKIADYVKPSLYREFLKGDKNLLLDETKEVMEEIDTQPLCKDIMRIKLNVKGKKKDDVSDNTSFNIYEIKSSNGKYYITSNNLASNLKFFGDDTVKRVTCLKENSNNRREIYAYTILYMHIYGIDNVRGGGITTQYLSRTSIDKYESWFRQLTTKSTVEDVLEIIN